MYFVPAGMHVLPGSRFSVSSSRGFTLESTASQMLQGVTKILKDDSTGQVNVASGHDIVDARFLGIAPVSTGFFGGLFGNGRSKTTSDSRGIGHFAPSRMLGETVRDLEEGGFTFQHYCRCGSSLQEVKRARCVRKKSLRNL